MHKRIYWLLEIEQIGVKKFKSFENAGKVCPVKYPQWFVDVCYVKCFVEWTSGVSPESVSAWSCFGAFSHNKSKEWFKKETHWGLRVELNWYKGTHTRRNMTSLNHIFLQLGCEWQLFEWRWFSLSIKTGVGWQLFTTRPKRVLEYNKRIKIKITLKMKVTIS